MCQTTYACSTVHIREHRVRVPCRTQTKTLFNNELKTEMTTIIPLANRARSHIALTRPSWVSLVSGERASGKRNPWDKLSTALNDTAIGDGNFGGQLLNHLCYADDICLISISSSGMQQLLNVCHSFSI